MIKKWTRNFSLLLVIMMILTVTVTPTISYATESPVAKIDGRPIKNGLDRWGKSGDTVITPFWGNYYYRITVNFAASPKKTKIKLKYTHQIRPTGHGTVKLTVGKNAVILRKFESFPYGYDVNYGNTANIYLESVKIKTGKKWKKVKITNDGVMSDGVHSEMKTLTLKKISKGTKLRITFNMRVGTPRR